MQVAAATGAAVGVTSAVLGTGAAAAVAAGAGAALAVGAGHELCSLYPIKTHP
jgi:hypothetical protein